MKTTRTISLLVCALLASPVSAQTAALAVTPPGGAAAQATSDYAIAVGNNTTAGTTSGGFPALTITPAWGYTSQIAIGAGNIAWGAGDVAIGTGAVAASQPAIGTTSAATAIGRSSAAWGTNSTAIGYRSLAGASSVGAPTTDPTVSNATALGGQASAQATNSTSIGANALASGVNSVALGYGTTATQDNTVAVGSRRIVGLANGTAATDAVTVQQLQAAIAGVGTVDSTAILNQANNYTDQAINNLRREYSRAIAAVAASPALPALAAGERALAIGGGIYNGQQSLGVAFGQAFSSGVVANAGLSMAGSGKTVLRAGVALKF